MHIPKIYKSEDFALLKEIISKHSFGLLISDKEKLFATHSMFLMNGKQDDFFLETHISKANFQAKALKNGDHVLCDFLGAHTYISSSCMITRMSPPGIMKRFRYAVWFI
ncbi:FMN-binding negative transcriptional regulator [Elizabethkingia meningoseptica]|uniref:FMN-binding negative transcriptional regulator n=1 Tax=Elizabethkingia meningoseptica TaxID=238 RepID=UPI0022F1D5AA|nr:FMN-binding negative transcriptional regulator [Elizabethkingia meningoseptica]WBS73347.1 FMN-binding negative transcriptional regulator [Elizabethkingia meningoseptica]